MYKKLIIPLLLCLLFISSCTQEETIVSSLNGTWNISEYIRSKIQNDGSDSLILHEEDAGTWEFSEDIATGHVSRFYVFTYTGSQGYQTSQGYMEVAEGGQQFILIGGICFDCDQVFTIEEFNGHHFTISSYSPQNNNQWSYKLKMVLDKQ